MPRKYSPAVQTLDRALKERTREGALGALYERLEGGKVRCYSCGHRCVILDGLDGICRVRHNQGGTLHVPRGYVAGLQVDPIEKKPFFHAFPGAVALSFGMLGCDYHCGYCFAPGTRILTSRGHLRIEEVFAGSQAAEKVSVSTHLGTSRPVVQVFRHEFHGRLIRIRPACLPQIEATPEHPFLVVQGVPPADGCPVAMSFVPAKDLSAGDWLVVPRDHDFSEAVVLRPAEALSRFATVFTTWRKIGRPVLERVLTLTRSGQTSRQIGRALGLDPSHVRHLRSQVARGHWNLERLDEKPAHVIEKAGHVRFSKEHAPGIPSAIPLDESFARLLGVYCAEGSVNRARDRRRSATLVFSFGHHEGDLADGVVRLVRETLGLAARRVRRQTTLCVDVGKASAALFFEALCGTGARSKRVPEPLFRAHRSIVEAFLRGYVDGDGYRAPNGTVTISTVSSELAAGVAGLLLRLGFLPQSYEYAQRVDRPIQGRPVRQSGTTHVVRWHTERRKPSNVREAPGYYLVPIRGIDWRDYDGPVYNLECSEEHTYIANGVAVHNCQNWLTSQALRDSTALSPPRDVEPEEILTIAKRYNAPAMVSTYNEPLITSEWAVEVFSVAKKEGITCGYVSNGNGTPEVLGYIRPYVDLYKVDLKGFRDSSYRELGGKLQNVLDTIERLHDMGFWVEIVTLLVPGFNDSPAELRELTSFLVSVSPDIPWHVTAFHQDYKMLDKANTTASHLKRAAAVGKEAGLRYVYAGNLPGQVGDLENTRCPNCDALLIERWGYEVLQFRLTDQGTCPSCRTPIAGFWRSGWKVPEKNGGLPGRAPQPVPVSAAPLFRISPRDDENTRS